MLNSKNIEISPHALNHLETGQRKVFKEEELLYVIRKETPRKVYLQENGRYGVYYRRKEGFRKIIIKIELEQAIIISFMDTAEIPKIRI